MTKTGNKIQTKLRVGDKIVDFGQVFRIFKIKTQKSRSGKKERVIFFRPYFRTDKNKDYVSSIPIGSIPLTRIRRPFSKSRLKKVLGKIAARPKNTNPVNVNRAKEKLKLNNPEATARIVRRLWRDKQDEETTYPTSKQLLMKTAMKGLIEEIALALKTTPEKAKERVEEELRKRTKSTPS